MEHLTEVWRWGREEEGEVSRWKFQAMKDDKCQPGEEAEKVAEKT